MNIILALVLIVYSMLSCAGDDNTRSLLREYVRLDTSNPPGNEARGAAFFADIFTAHGIEYEIIEVAPGRANIWARLPGGNNPTLMLLHHMDVVPAYPKRWLLPPFAGTVDGSYVHGRGTLDAKSLGIFHLQAFLALKAQGKPLNRDVIFLATADEEAGGKYGVGWLMEHRPELFEHIGAVFNEGGWGAVRNGSVSFGIEVTQKLPLWLRINARGEPGHGASPHKVSATQRLIRALVNLQQFQFPAHLLPNVKNYLSKVAEDYPAPWAERLLNAEALVNSPEQMAELHAFDHRLYAQLRSTCAITRLQASNKVNVVAAEAWAEIDCRLLPNHKPEHALETLKNVFADESLEITTLLSFAPGMSPVENPFYQAIEKNLTERFPKSDVVARMAGGFTDSHFFREKGIPAYGFSPLMLTPEAVAGVHGDNEKISLKNLRFGRDFMESLVGNICID